MKDSLLSGFLVAQTKVPGVSPDSSAPGGGLLQELINQAGFIGLCVAVLSIIVGATIWGFSRMGNNPKAQGGAARVVGTGAAIGFIVGIASWAVSIALSFGQQIK